MTASEILRRLIEAEQAYREALRIVQAQGGQLFKEVRKQHGLTQRQFAEVLGVDFSFISKVENGHMRAGKPVLERLAAYLARQTESE